MNFSVWMLCVNLVLLTGPGQQVIGVNPETVVSVRAPRSCEHFALGTRCLITTSDGKFISVAEPCPAVRKLFESNHVPAQAGSGVSR